MPLPTKPLDNKLNFDHGKNTFKHEAAAQAVVQDAGQTLDMLIHTRQGYKKPLHH